MNAETDSRSFLATILRTSRRVVNIIDQNGQIFSAFNPPCSLDIVVGDEVCCELNAKDVVVKKVLTRRNCLKRAAAEREKRLAANLDHILIVTAPPPLYNTTFIDRVSVAAGVEKIPFSLVVNKIDLISDSDKLLFNTYRNLGINIYYTSAKTNVGIEALRELMLGPGLKKIALVGVSGVGKSSLINLLIPNTDARVSETSWKTGQGRQTTSSAFAHSYNRDDGSRVFLIDLPGIHNFGLCHVSEAQLRVAFPEIMDAAASCQFDDCTHLLEPGCEVKILVDENKIAVSRYQSYTDILEELRSKKPY
ncbi:MAG: ribosome small subunit-dependent GTPase A [SAR324 cluster bacterium]|uniref:Small ribosomal subunit biogenesis GTPase RsgA n=1 Tax=SAR324 cluster bacterium TaxID=2024889 RepID=A0A7X9IJ56_9DELT|nr:ribosome small subunit-dependent GTPase A [SAR324 cluster bacterium]